MDVPASLPCRRTVDVTVLMELFFLNQRTSSILLHNPIRQCWILYTRKTAPMHTEDFSRTSMKFYSLARSGLLFCRRAAYDDAPFRRC